MLSKGSAKLSPALQRRSAVKLGQVGQRHSYVTRSMVLLKQSSVLSVTAAARKEESLKICIVVALLLCLGLIFKDWE